MKVTKNLGLVKAIFVGDNPPININVIWRDTSLIVPLHKYYNQLSGQWESFITAVQVDNISIKKDGMDRIFVDTEVLDITYRMATASIAGNTQINFSSPMPNNQFFVSVLSYVATGGVVVGSGWSSNSANTINGFTFIPPSKYPNGSLIYIARLFK